jgi:hypothetical protein
LAPVWKDHPLPQLLPISLHERHLQQSRPLSHRLLLQWSRPLFRRLSLLLLKTWLIWPLPSPFILRKGCAPRSRSFLHRLSPPLQDRYAFFLCNYFGLPPQYLAYPLFLQNLNLSELLAFDPASIGSAILEADDPPLDLTSTAS